MSTPSLLLVPARLKDGTLFSQIPTNGSGDFTVVQAVGNATRVNASGFVESAKTNLISQSENFATTWTTSNLSFVTGQTSNFATPNGATNAYFFTESTDSVASEHRLQHSTIGSVVSGTTYTVSVFAKAASVRNMRFALSTAFFVGSPVAVFNLNSGTVVFTQNSTAQIQSYGNDWYRCSMTAVCDANGTSVLLIQSASGTSQTYIGNGSNAFYLYGAQFEAGPSASDYIPTTTVARTKFSGVTVNGTSIANIPRLDYYTSSGAPGCPGLLVEPSAKNFWLQSENLSSASWLKLQAGSGIATTVSASTESLFGLPTFEVTFTPNGTSSGDTSTIRQGFTPDATGNHTQSWYIRSLSGTQQLQAFFASQIVQLTITETPTRITATVNLTSITTWNSGLTQVGTHTRTNGKFLITAAQMEAGSVATSYIPTTTGSVTRNADVISASGNVSGSIGQTEGSIYAEVNIQKLLGTTQRAIVDIGQSTNRLFLGYGNGLTNQIRFLLQTSSGGLVDINSSATSTGTIKIAVGYKNNDSIMYVNGVIGTFLSNDSFTSSLNTLTGLSIGSSNIVGETHFLNDRINAVALYATRLSNADLMLLTMPGNSTYLPQAVWNNYLSRPGNTEVPDCLYTRHADLLDV